MFSRIRKSIFTYRELKYLAYHDCLTGLLNRNWLYKKVDSKRYLYIYFIDLNNLRMINYSGHTFGDIHIKKCVDNILTKINNTDCLIRYAGDEFILLSKHKNIIKTNDLFSVGFSEIISNDLTSAINNADTDMIKEKAHWNMNN